ncbi:rab GTPase-binding effector protein 1-like [Ylistrum balloti]|uniref:rab GTPase-binding effector protein 1-like n=1 Tax=Ylistrum balloti TaxID=509963 RepID=UPI002905BEAA|nr:rab GTPase-binding effector protein 1-like [Ylistrum balloti]
MAEIEHPASPEATEESEDSLLSLKGKVAELLKEKQNIEEDFGQKRAKFKEIYLQKEEELRKEKLAVKESQDIAKKLQEDLDRVKGELEGIKTAVAYSESNKQDEIASIHEQCQQEVASLQHLMKEVANEASRNTALKYETEREKLQELNENYEEELLDLRNKLYGSGQDSGGEGFLSSVAKQLKLVSVGQHSTSNSQSEFESLEESMKKAQADAEILKSVVMPLEDEVKMLKEKLKEAVDKIHQLQSQHSPVGGMSPSHRQMTPDTQSLPDMDQVRDPEERIKELLHYLRTEKSSRKDLEMFVAVLTTQKNVFAEDADKLRLELEDVCTILDEEKKAHEELKQTWQMANDQFLESQRLMMMDLRRMESVLSTEQQRQIAELQQKDLEREAQEKKVKGLEELRLKQQREQEERRRTGAMKKAEEANEKLKAKEAEASTRLLTSNSSTTHSRTRSSDSDLNFTGDSTKSLSDPDLANVSQEGDSFLEAKVVEADRSELDGIRVQISPEKTLNLPSLSEAQKRAITDPTPDFEARQTLLASAKHKNERTALTDGRRLVSQKEWDLLQQQLREAREKLGRPCDMCNNYEAQLQGVQEASKEEQVKANSLDRQLKVEKQVNENQKKYIAELEESLKSSAEEAEKQVSSLVNQVQQCEKFITESRQQYTQSQLELQDQLKTLTESREQVHKELTRLQTENDSLIGKHSKTALQLQNEDINLPSSLEEMQLLLLKYREEIIKAKVAKEHTEDTLKGEIMFLKDQVLAEQQEKTTIEETLTQDIQGLQEKLVVQDSLKSELERESAVRAEVETKLRETEQSLKSIQAKSKQLINALQQQVEQQSEARAKLETDVNVYRNKVASLQVDLDNSETVQRDFVKLSQSLQIQLEKIRQAETEVRWQHEDDVDECTNCKQAFSVTKRKHHCRHCGRIFCADCTMKTVTNANNRVSKVCDICHTILVKDAMPYFSTEPPNVNG